MENISSEVIQWAKEHWIPSAVPTLSLLLSRINKQGTSISWGVEGQPFNNTGCKEGREETLRKYTVLFCSALSSSGCLPTLRGLPLFAHPYLQAHALRLEQELMSVLSHKSQFGAWSYIFNSVVELWDVRVERWGSWELIMEACLSASVELMSCFGFGNRDMTVPAEISPRPGLVSRKVAWAEGSWPCCPRPKAAWLLSAKRRMCGMSKFIQASNQLPCFLVQLTLISRRKGVLPKITSYLTKLIIQQSFPPLSLGQSYAFFKHIYLPQSNPL